MRTLSRFSLFRLGSRGYAGVVETYVPQNVLKRIRRIQLQPETPIECPDKVEILNDKKPDTKRVSLVLEQYRELQLKYPKHIILMQVGDFFEIFDNAAKNVSQVLDIGLCESRYGTTMTGFPLRTMDTYLDRLVKVGSSLVLVEQQELTPSSSVITRRVTRIITPGTITEENLLDSGTNNFMLSVEASAGGFGLAWIDLSTGYFRMLEIEGKELYNELVRINPIEIISNPKLWKLEEMNRFVKNHRAVLSELEFSEDSAAFVKLFGSNFDSNAFTVLELAAGLRLLNYVTTTQIEKRPYIECPQRHSQQDSVRLDAAALRALEILRNNSTNTKENSLLDVIDETCTAAGSRLLIQRLQTPLLKMVDIERRLDQLALFCDREELLTDIRSFLKKCKDLERCFQRLALNRSTGGPRDMQAIQQTLKQACEIQKKLCAVNVLLATDLGHRINSCLQLVDVLERAIVDSPPARASDGGLVRPGYSVTLDELRGEAVSLESRCAALVEKYRKETKSKSLRLVNRKTLGWFVEVNRSEGKLENDRFVLDGQIDKKYRYRTDELNSLNRDFTMGGEEILKEEVYIYEELRDKVIAAGDKIMETARTLAELDIIASNALLAKKRGFTRPLLRDSFEFTIENGRHPVVEHKHADVGRSFVYNSCNLGPSKRFALVTGPNMGGKSTFLRQNALIAIMAQCGMYVPADRAVLGLVDAVYTRIGASDDLSRDRSTFMVEMIETSNILNQASPQSLVIMDEVGRGTAAKEGYSLAWGICKYLYSKGCRTLFATHYSDLSKLVTTFPHSQCLMSAARLDADGLYFLHQIFQGVATKSHAIEIAKLAGMPEEVLLAALEIDEPKE